jgi:ABC-type multidrug transport system ATPase subunit
MGDFFMSKGTVRSFGSGILLNGLKNCFYLRAEDVLFEELSVEEHFKLFQIIAGIP